MCCLRSAGVGGASPDRCMASSRRRGQHRNPTLISPVVDTRRWNDECESSNRLLIRRFPQGGRSLRRRHRACNQARGGLANRASDACARLDQGRNGEAHEDKPGTTRPVAGIRTTTRSNSIPCNEPQRRSDERCIWNWLNDRRCRHACAYGQATRRAMAAWRVNSRVPQPYWAGRGALDRSPNTTETGNKQANSDRRRRRGSHALAAPRHQT